MQIPINDLTIQFFENNVKCTKRRVKKFKEFKVSDT